MATNQNSQFKDPERMVQWLEEALKAEQEKYKQCPVLPDLMPGHSSSWGWGYVVVGYFLLEESFKALLSLRGTEPPKTHSLTILFDLFEPDDQETLREHYLDYRATVGGYLAGYPFATLDEFLANLDGDPNKKGTDYTGSFDWRYSPIEEPKSQNMPFMSVDYQHEVAYGCNLIVKSVHYGSIDPRQHTYSRRMLMERRSKYNAWLTARMNSAGWGDLPDRWEILWGPDPLGQYDLLRFEAGSIVPRFDKLPENPSLPIVDKRAEVEAFDVNDNP